MRAVWHSPVSEADFAHHLWARHVEYESHFHTHLGASAEIRRRLLVLEAGVVVTTVIVLVDEC